MNREDACSIVYRFISRKYNIEEDKIVYGYVENAEQVGIELAYLELDENSFSSEVVENHVENGKFIVELYDCFCDMKNGVFKYDLLEHVPDLPFESKECWQ